MYKIILVFFLFIGFNSFAQLGIIDNNTTALPPYTGQYKLSSDGDRVYFRGRTGGSKEIISTNNTYLNPTWISQINAANIGTGIVSTTEFNHLNNLTDNIQTQIDNRLLLTPSATFLAIGSSVTVRLILVTVDETNSNQRTFYLHDGVGLHWIPTVKLY